MGRLGTVREVRWVRYGGNGGYGTVGTVRWVRYGGYGGTVRWVLLKFDNIYYHVQFPPQHKASGQMSRDHSVLV